MEPVRPTLGQNMRQGSGWQRKGLEETGGLGWRSFIPMMGTAPAIGTLVSSLSLEVDRKWLDDLQEGSLPWEGGQTDV